MAAPFYSDPSQRILVLSINQHQLLVINVELLLELAREWEGQSIELDGWGGNTIQIHLSGDTLGGFGVFGCRLFWTASDWDDEGSFTSYLRIWSFNHADRAKHLRGPISSGTNRGVRQMSPSFDECRLPWHIENYVGAPITAGNDSFIFCVVSVLVPVFTSSQSNEGFMFVRSLRTRTRFLNLRLERCTNGVCEDATEHEGTDIRIDY